MKAKRTAHRKTPAQIEATRKSLMEIVDWCREGWIEAPLFQLHRFTVWRVMEDLAHGRDPRVGLGIPAKIGAPSGITHGFNSWMAGHYWHLRQTEKAAVAERIVADTWGVSVPQVKKAATANRVAWQERLASEQFRTDNFEGMAKVYREQQQQLRK